MFSEAAPRRGDRVKLRQKSIATGALRPPQHLHDLLLPRVPLPLLLPICGIRKWVYLYSYRETYLGKNPSENVPALRSRNGRETGGRFAEAGKFGDELSCRFGFRPDLARRGVFTCPMTRHSNASAWRN